MVAVSNYEHAKTRLGLFANQISVLVSMPVDNYLATGLVDPIVQLLAQLIVGIS
jgi:hypothetical protein